MNTNETRTNTDPGREIMQADSDPRPESSPNAPYNRTNQGSPEEHPDKEAEVHRKRLDRMQEPYHGGVWP